MKKMKTTIAATIALAACASTQLFAQPSPNVKSDTITFSLTEQGQASVSTSASALNAGSWLTQNLNKDGSVAGVGPLHYKTTSKKLTQADIIHAIGIVLHGSAGYYSSQAKLVLVQGELSGFFNITPDLAASTADTNLYFGDSLVKPKVTGTSSLDGTFTTGDTDTDTGLQSGLDSLYAQLATGRHFLGRDQWFL